MPFDPQPNKIVPRGYTVTLADLGWVLFALGSITLPTFGDGFYVTIINFKGAPVVITVPNASVVSVSGVTTLTSQWQHATLMTVPGGSDYVLLGLT